jgi:hypothetical protein
MGRALPNLSLRAAFMLCCVKHAYDVLSKEQDLSPRNEKINKALTALVNTACLEYDGIDECSVLNDPYLKVIKDKLLDKLSQAEGAMEEFWAERLNQKDALSLSDLKEFWYWDNYEQLTKGEISHFPSLDLNQGESIAFVGSGPLPLTAIIMHLETGLPVTCIDNDEKAAALSRTLLEKAGLSDQIRVVHSDGAHHDYSAHPVTIVASLVPNKDKVVQAIKSTRAQAFIGLRSAERMHALLYRPVNQDDANLKDMAYEGKTRHDPATINTTLFYRAGLQNIKKTYPQISLNPSNSF